MSAPAAGQIRLDRSDLRGQLAALALGSTAEAAFWIALVVQAHVRGGVVESGLVVLVHLAVAAWVAPILLVLGERLGRPRPLVDVCRLQALGLAGLAALVVIRAPIAVVYAASVGTYCTLCLTRPVSSALGSRRLDSDAGRTRANALRVLAECSGDLTGPLLGALLFALGGIPLALGGVAAMLVTALESGLLDEGTVSPCAPRDAMGSRPLRIPSAEDAPAVEPAARRWRGLTLGVALPTVLGGAVELSTPGLAAELLGAGGFVAGLLASALGVGAVLGAIGACTVGASGAGPERFAASLLAAAAATIAIAAARAPTTLVVLLLLCGFANGWAWVVGTTLVQRAAVGPRPLGLFGRIEGCESAGIAIATVVVGFLSQEIGVAGGIAAIGAAAIVIGLAGLGGGALIARRGAGRLPRPARPGAARPSPVASDAHRGLGQSARRRLALRPL
ncbi:MAG: hypothetical protein R3F35_11015 [Myxococcota bacterium]